MESNSDLIIILNDLQRHISALKSHLEAEYKEVYIIGF
jgi:hypothetical protein